MEEELSELDGDPLAEDFDLKENSLLLRKQNINTPQNQTGVTLFESSIPLSTGSIPFQWIVLSSLGGTIGEGGGGAPFLQIKNGG